MIEIKFLDKEIRAVAYDKEIIIGECNFVRGKNTWNIVHTEVNKLYKGQKIAKGLVECVIDNAKKQNKILIADCSYAKNMLEKIK